MKPLRLVGVILIVLGLVVLAYQGLTYTTGKKVVDLGPLKVEAKARTISVPPVAGAVAVVAGLLLVVLFRR